MGFRKERKERDVIIWRRWRRYLAMAVQESTYYTFVVISNLTNSSSCKKEKSILQTYVGFIITTSTFYHFREREIYSPLLDF